MDVPGIGGREVVLKLPRLYPILDVDALHVAGISLAVAAAALDAAGVRWVQYRDKQSSDAEYLEAVRALRKVFPPGRAVLLVNDRVHLCGLAGADGVHVGQQDLAPREARRLLGSKRILGVSTHNAAELELALASGAADYLAMGPVFVTGSKQRPDPVVGLAGVAAARERTRLPLVAIGGINRERARSVIEAGADAVAVIAGMLPGPGADMEETVRDFLSYLR